MNKKYLSLLAALLVIMAGAGLMLLLTSFKAEPARMEEAVPSRLVKTDTLIPATRTQWIRADGFLVSPRQLKIYAPLAGKVSYAHPGLKGGTFVQEGDLLLELDDRRARLAFESTRTEMIHLSTQYLTLAGMDRTYQNRWENYLTALAQADPARLPPLPQGDTRQEQLAVTKGVTAAYYRLESAAMDLEDHSITASFSGVLTGPGLSPGAWVSPGVPLGELWQINPLELPLSVGISEIDQVDLDAEVFVTGPGGQVIKGQVIRKEPYLTTRSQSVLVHVGLNFTQGQEWPPGAFVQARIRGRQWENAYQVPREALMGGKIPLYEEDRLVLKEITILGKEGHDIIFEADLVPGAEYVTTLLQSPLEGMRLKKEEL